MTSIGIVGCGDIGQRVANLCLNAKIDICAWVKSDHSALACDEKNIPCQRVDLDAASLLDQSDRLRQLFYTVPPSPTGHQDLRINNFLTGLNYSGLEKIVLISTTGVYGDCHGNWIDESQPIQPSVDRAIRRADAEAKLIDWANLNQCQYIILRVPGIYAKDRLPIKRVKSGAPVLARKESPWSNRIHADDLANACFAALTLPIKNEIINVTDDAPSTITDYFFAVANYAKLPQPPEISIAQAKQQLSAGLLSYMSESRRIRNHKMKRILGVKLNYPTLEDGLRL